MKLTRIYCPVADSKETVILASSQSHHVLHVLRLKVGDSLLIFDGCGNEYEAQLVAIKNKLALVQLGECCDVRRESPLKLELVQGIAKKERMDFVIQKAVELGVSVITPVFSQRCEIKLSQERMQNRMAHWSSVILNACEQSGRLIIPSLNTPVSFEKYLRQHCTQLRFIAVPGGQRLSSSGICPRSATVIIGPEEGFSEEEVEIAVSVGCTPLGLGARILRTETAGIVALSVLQMHWGDL